MLILDPKENINSIVSLIENAKEFVVIVSPYSNLEGWDKLKKAINKASDTGIEVSYYVRQGECNKGLEGLNVKIFEVPLLHAKLFINEKIGMISSFHLMNNNDINWAFIIEDDDEYLDLTEFFQKNIKDSASICSM